MTLAQVFAAVVLIGLLLLVSEWFRNRVRLLKALFIPASIIAGALALLLGPQVLGAILPGIGVTEPAWLAEGLFPEGVISAWRAMPGILINVVFAALFLGKTIPGIREIWDRAGPQVVFGQTLAWGQYVVGILLAILVLNPVFGLPYLAGALIEIGFEGGHGTAAGLRAQFEELGFAEGYDLAMGMATIGIVMGVVLGTILINWAARARHISIREMEQQLERGGEGAARFGHEGQISDDQADPRKLEYATPDLVHPRPAEPAEPVRVEPEDQPTDPLSLHLGLVALAVGIGWLIHQGLIFGEIGIRALFDGNEDAFLVMGKIPLFPLAMLGGVMVQLVIMRLGKEHLVHRRLMNRISGTALDFTIVAALATLSLAAIGANLIPFLLLAGTGIAWCLFAVIFLAPRLIPYGWFERGVGDFGQSMGVTVTGLLLMRVADPPNKAGALESFGYKQLLFEPIVGGGLFTATSMVLIFTLGPWWVLGITSSLMAFFLIFGLLVFGPEAKRQRDLERQQRQ